jgi:hypothetical protein
MKVLVLGLPKSGTTILAYRVFDALPGRWKKLYFERGRLRGAEDTAFHQRVCRGSRNVVSKNLVNPDAHTDWDAIFGSIACYDRSIWIARDPRDVLVSTFFYYWFRRHRVPAERYRKALTLTKEKERAPASLPFFRLVSDTMTGGEAPLAQWQQDTYGRLAQQAGRLAEQCQVLRYEDLIDGRLAELNDYLGVVVENRKEVPGRRRRVVRSRGYGDWRQWFTSEDIEFFQPMYAGYLQAMGYEAENWRLANPATLPSSSGSGYMQSLRRRLIW